MSGDYEVGYGKPPKSHQFRKGKSGNLKGRPKKQLDADLPEIGPILDKPLRATNRGKEIEICPREAIYRKQIERALKEHHRPSLRALIDELIKYNLIPKVPEEPTSGVLTLPQEEFQKFQEQLNKARVS
jgi:hypothetical protein